MSTKFRPRRFVNGRWITSDRPATQPTPGRKRPAEIALWAKIRADRRRMTLPALARKYRLPLTQVHYIARKIEGPGDSSNRYTKVAQALAERNARVRADRPRMTLSALMEKHGLSYATIHNIVAGMKGPREPRQHGERVATTKRNAKIRASKLSITALAKRYRLSYLTIYNILHPPG